MWTIQKCRDLAADLVSNIHPRWEHLSSVGRLAENLAEQHPQVSERVVMAAWLHDIGYAADLARLGFHPVDGARHLQTLGAPEGIAELVAFHTGATYEAEERGFVAELDAFTPPSEQELNLVTMCDLAVAPTGDLIVDEKRIVEILDRYEPGHPVYSAVSRSRASLLAASSAGKRQLGVPSDWPLTGCHSAA